MGSEPFLPHVFVEPWVVARDGDESGMALFRRHYSHRPGRRKVNLFVGPGDKLVLLTPCARALFVWRKFVSRAGEIGVNCAVFRNEGAGLSSVLIRAAMRLAWLRWPGERLYTYVNPRKVRSTNPGFCFLVAGWRRCGVTAVHRLLILEALP